LNEIAHGDHIFLENSPHVIVIEFVFQLVHAFAFAQTD
jgi:hypothetical protein